MIVKNTCPQYHQKAVKVFSTIWIIELDSQGWLLSTCMCNTAVVMTLVTCIDTSSFNAALEDIQSSEEPLLKENMAIHQKMKDNYKQHADLLLETLFLQIS